MRHQVWILLAACIGLMGLGPGRALASGDSMYCPKSHGWVSVGDLPSKVLAKCGEPKLRDPVVHEGCTDDGYRCNRVVGERWVYDFGWGYLIRYLLFQRGRLMQIEDGDYSEEP